MFLDRCTVRRIACREHRFVRGSRARVIAVSVQFHVFWGDFMRTRAASNPGAAGRYRKSIVGTAGGSLLTGAICRVSGLRERRRPLSMPTIAHWPVLTICRRGYRAPQVQAAIPRSSTAMEPAVVFSHHVGLKGEYRRRHPGSIGQHSALQTANLHCSSTCGLPSLLTQSPKLFSQ